jgi:hypothetical protein
MASKASLSPLIHKQVPLKFDGASLNLSLSHALFSSHKVDPGSLFLLKTLAQQRDFTQVNRLLDWGCGVGTLGLAVKKRHPRTDVTMIDRQVLAAEFTELNAQNNGLEVTVLPGIGHFGIPGPFDLVLSNWPAKAGYPVLTNFVDSIAHSLDEKGAVAMVIVAPLWEELLSLVMSNGAEILYQESNPQYGVLHFRPRAKSPCEPGAFLRTHGTYRSKIAEYSLETVSGLGSFDQLSYEEELLSAELNQLKGNVAFWEPGQGHLPLIWTKTVKNRDPEQILYLAGSDILSLWISHRNIHNLPQNRPLVQSLGLAQLTDLRTQLPAGSLDSLVAPYRPVPETKDMESFWLCARELLKPGALLLSAGKSAHIHRLLSRSSGFHLIKDKKKKGVRMVLLKKDLSPS